MQTAGNTVTEIVPRRAAGTAEGDTEIEPGPRHHVVSFGVRSVRTASACMSKANLPEDAP